jgi:hypothetical protein
MRMLAEAVLAIAAGVLLLACVHQVAEVAPAGDESLCERLAADRGAECATVRQFAMQTDCPGRKAPRCGVPDRYIEAAEARYGHSWPSQDERFEPYALAGVDPPCFFACPPIVGTNAKDGAWCPPEGVPPHWYPATWEAPAILCRDSRLTFTSDGWTCL